VKVAVREGASLIPRASYQTVSRLQQLLSAQNTQALPFQLKGSLTKSKEEKKYPAGRELVSLQHKGLVGGPSIAPSPSEPQPQVPWQWGEQRVCCGARWPRGVSGSQPGVGVLGWFWGAVTRLRSPCKPRLWGSGQGVKGWGEKAPRGGWR